MLYLILRRFSKIAIFGLVFSTFSFLANAQCEFNEELISANQGLCQPALFKLIVKNVPTGSKLYWDIGKGMQPGYDTFYAYVQNPGKINVNVQVKYSNGKVCNLFKNDFEKFEFPDLQTGFLHGRGINFILRFSNLLAVELDAALRYQPSSLGF